VAGAWQTGSSPTHTFSAPSTSVWAAYGWTIPPSVGSAGPSVSSVPPGGILIRMSFPNGAPQADQMRVAGTFQRVASQGSGASFRLARKRTDPLFRVSVHFGDNHPSAAQWRAVYHELDKLTRSASS
jgi:hypothetical protein